MANKTLTVKALSELLSCSEWKVRELANSGKIPSFRLGPNGSIRFHPEDIDKWMKNQNRAA